MRYHKIPDETVRRLPIYLRGLMVGADQGRDHISSQSLADFVGVESWQIRKDFSYFGDFGTRGVGYNIEKLAREIKKILRLDIVRKAALVGVGDLGSALLAYPGFATYGLDIIVAFEVDPQKIGRMVNGVTIEDAAKIDTLGQRGITLAIVAVPRAAAQATVNKLVEAGVRGILNFAPSKVIAPRRVKVITLDIAMELARLPYYMPAGGSNERALGGKGAE
ncbi:MAG: redox-sensing transcriptional repressor Rex [Planctomycetes bacterium RBG_13_60_9]|nr:MAG: redox-sensing transcriptional repressor Rex [Planctomycetes bacterium RBG_13_60_9]